MKVCEDSALQQAVVHEQLLRDKSVKDGQLTAGQQLTEWVGGGTQNSTKCFWQLNFLYTVL